MANSNHYLTKRKNSNKIAVRLTSAMKGWFIMPDQIQMSFNCQAGYLDWYSILKRGNARLRQKSLHGERLRKDQMCLRLGLWLKEFVMMVYHKEEIGFFDEKGLQLMHRTNLDENTVRTSFKPHEAYSKLNSDFHKFIRALFKVSKAEKIEYRLYRETPRYVEIYVVMPLHDIPYPTIFLQQLLRHINLQPPK